MTEENAIDNYLVWQLCKEKDIQRKIIEGSINEDQIKEIIGNVRKEYREKDYNLNDKINLIQKLDNNPEYRSEIFQNCSWKKETVNIEDLGTTLPRLGDLPPEVISGSLPKVVRFVRNADPEEYQSVKYIMKLRKHPELVKQFFPWVLIPGNRASKRDKMNNVNGEKDWDIENTWGMINDGNHRAIAKILANDLEEIECYAGYRENSI